MSAIIKQSTVFAILLLVASQSLALSITHVSHTPVYTESKNRDITVRFVLDDPATVNLSIYDDRELLIRKITHSGLNKGENAINWDGNDSAGKSVPPEAYHYTLTASSGSDTVVYDTSDITGNDSIPVSNLSWDKKAGTLNYTLRKNSRVNLRVGIKDGGPLLATVLDWQPRKRGSYQEKWNGWDNSGTLNIKKLKDIQLFGQAYSLSNNTIIIGPQQIQSQYSNNIADSGERRTRSNPGNKMFNYQARDAAARSDFNIDVALPEGLRQDKNKLPVFTGSVPIRISIPKQDLIRMQVDRFEPMLFVDGIYVSELESGFFPLTWKLNTKNYTEGEHFITVNVRGYEGQAGTASRRIVIKH